MTSSGESDDWRQWRRRMMTTIGWRRWMASMASMVGVDGGGLGSSTQRALTWKSLCVPEMRMTRTVVACFQSEQFAGEQRICPCAVLSFMSVDASLA